MIPRRTPFCGTHTNDVLHPRAGREARSGVAPYQKAIICGVDTPIMCVCGRRTRGGCAATRRCSGARRAARQTRRSSRVAQAAYSLRLGRSTLFLKSHGRHLMRIPIGRGWRCVAAADSLLRLECDARGPRLSRQGERVSRCAGEPEQGSASLGSRRTRVPRLAQDCAATLEPSAVPRISTGVRIQRARASARALDRRKTAAGGAGGRGAGLASLDLLRLARRDRASVRVTSLFVSSQRGRAL